jgi:hypothetical protein
MDTLLVALGPAFAAGFAVQRLLEILDPLIGAVKAFKDHKKLLLVISSFIAGLILTFGLGLRVLEPLGVTESPALDGLVTALVVSAGTEGFNSILKFLTYAKDDKKAEAAKNIASLGKEGEDALMSLG